MRIVSLNLNGIRAAVRKGLVEWLHQTNPDIVCLQELKAQEHNIAPLLPDFKNYQCHFSYAQRPGYSGVGVLCKQRPQKVTHEFGDADMDSEGRFIQVDFNNLTVISLYLPSGTSGDERQAVKYRLMAVVEKRLAQYQQQAAKQQRHFVICGDFNIAHTQKDICNWRGNQKNSGFLPEEREWLSQLLASGQWVDVFRHLNDNEGEYTWWSNRGQAWAKNVGWRIDYQFTTRPIAQLAQDTHIYKTQRFSDHAPLIVDYKKFKL